MDYKLTTRTQSIAQSSQVSHKMCEGGGGDDGDDDGGSGDGGDGGGGDGGLW